ncbi:MAG: DNA-binding protein [Clostridia bacterium]|nr:DNA-binding protein [Clostridia bacterium]
MFEKNLKFAYLLDFYGSVLDGHTEEVMKAYYDDDLSLAEVAEGLGISRQGVRHIIKRGEEQLEFLEGRLALSKRHEALEAISERLKAIADSSGTSETARAELHSIAESILQND